MARPHIEFIQAQTLPWTIGSDGVERKVLSQSPDSEACAFLARVPPGWRVSSSSQSGLAEEFFVLDGSIDIDGRVFSRHAYGFMPTGHDWSLKQSAGGATLILFRFDRSDVDGGSGEPIALDSALMPWDVSLYDPKLIHLRLARKVLRLGPNDSGRTYLLTGLPHGRPDVESLQLELHPHAEEMFLISGELCAPEGLMVQGAYFYRPPGIPHGPHVSDLGFLMLMRNPGSNRVVTHWQEEQRPLPVDPVFNPGRPVGSPEALRQPMPRSPAY